MSRRGSRHQVLLAVGNYLNSGFRGGAYGFKIDAVLKVRAATPPAACAVLRKVSDKEQHPFAMRANSQRDVGVMDRAGGTR